MTQSVSVDDDTVWDACAAQCRVSCLLDQLLNLQIIKQQLVLKGVCLSLVTVCQSGEFAAFVCHMS